jgi:hypothetical protein
VKKILNGNKNVLAISRIITAENIQYPHLRHALDPLKPSTKFGKSPANTIIPTSMNNT